MARLVSEPVRAPVRQLVNHYAVFFEDLIHAIKSEIIGRFDELDRTIAKGNEQLTDELGTQAATIRTLQSEVERLQAMVEVQAREPRVERGPDRRAATVPTTA